jgi:hypothetical protein
MKYTTPTPMYPFSATMSLKRVPLNGAGYNPTPRRASMKLEIGQQLTIWVVRGDEGGKLFWQYFATKIEAEKAAREMYPGENAIHRYARISYITTEPHEEV